MSRDLPKQPIEAAFLTVSDASMCLRLTRQTIHTLMQSREIPSVKLGGSRLIPKSFIDGLLLKAGNVS
jgi:excisionase family DNA binding protein